MVVFVDQDPAVEEGRAALAVTIGTAVVVGAGAGATASGCTPHGLAQVSDAQLSSELASR